MTSIDLPKYWSDAWENTLEDVRQRVGDEAMQQQFRTANKRKPEDKAWWYTNGLEMLKKYQKDR